MKFDFDLLVIGAGSGGVRSSRMAAAKGARVAVIENRYLGGTCVNAGCVPKKLFVYASEYASQLSEGHGFGVDSQLKAIDWPKLRGNKTNEINRLNGIYNNMLEGSGVTVLHGTGSLTGPNSVSVDGTEYTAERILIATGGWPHMPKIPGIELAMSSNEAFHLDQLPKKIVVVGGGYIAVEFAGIFNGLGVDTHLCCRGDQILRGFDQQVREFAAAEVEKKGVQICPNTQIIAIEKLADGQLLCQLDSGETITCDTVMYATGRRPMTDGLNLESLGIQQRDDGTLIVDDHFRTPVPSVFALGDIIGTPALTPVALAQGMTFVAQQFDKDPTPTDYQFIATAVFCQPNIATVGLTEEQAQAELVGDYDIYQSEFRPMKHTLSGSDERALMKLIVQRSTDRLVGAHMVGADSGEIMQGIAAAMKAGITKKILDSTIGIHPTSAEEFVTMRQVSRRG